MNAPPGGTEDGQRATRVRRHADGRALDRSDAVAVEEPLEIRLGDRPLAVAMRTPGHDEELVVGLLLTERVISAPEDVVSVRHCSVAPAPEADGNVIRAVLREGVDVDLERLRRNLYASSSCGVCGKATLENALAAAAPLDDPARFAAAQVRAFPGRLRAVQPLFDATGGVHAAALFDPDGELLVAREDIGRHNAVDKVIGWAVRARRFPLRGHALAVSGRASYEIVQKALAARVPLLAAVSAPSSLAVALAEDAGIALAGFVRDGGFNLYGAVNRVTEAVG